MNDPLREFFSESLENLDQFDAGLLVLEKNPNSPKTIASIFRTLHTIKGTCGFLGLKKLESIAHAAENLLVLVRDGCIPFTAQIASALLSTGDAVRAIIAELESTKKEGDSDYSGLIQSLVNLQSPPPLPAASSPQRSETATPLPQKNTASKPGNGKSEVPIPSESDAGKPPQELDISHGSRALDNTVRIHVEALDALMNLVGELVLTRNQIVKLASNSSDEQILSAAYKLSSITADLQDRIMKTRVQPVEVLWSKLPRTVRDLAQMCEKKIRLKTEGSETELDRGVVEAIRDPLVHLLRNSIDHGIETPEKRIAAGKNPEGTILLRASHAAGLVTIEILDDGGGINVEKVRTRAIERGLIDAATADRMFHKDLVNLIFLPGFSTAEKVGLLSGRGVGMDVVKTQIEKIGGFVELYSEQGRGTTFRIKIPLTLAIIPAVIVECSKERFAIPQSNLSEVLRLDQNLPIEIIREKPFVRLRGSLLPIVKLQEALKLPDSSFPSQLNLVVLQVGARQFGLVVDAIRESEEIVVKPIGRILMRLSCFSGATILGDGSVCMILDVLGLGSSAGIFNSDQAPGLQSLSEPTPASAPQQKQDSNDSELLVFRVGGSRAAVPLSQVSRLLEFPANSVEVCAGRNVVQYGGKILPLISTAKAIGLPETHADPHVIQTILFEHHTSPVCLIIESVEAILKESFHLKQAGKRHGVLGSAIIGKRVTEMIDVPEIAKKHAPEFVPPLS